MTQVELPWMPIFSSMEPQETPFAQDRAQTGQVLVQGVQRTKPIHAVVDLDPLQTGEAVVGRSKGIDEWCRVNQ